MLVILAILAVLPLLTPAASFQSAALSDTIPETLATVVLFANGKSTSTPIKNSSINASDRGFYINRPTVAHPCPASAHCDLPTNVTAVIVHRNTTANLASLGATNQMFVNGTDGALTYNPTHGTNVTTVQFNTSAIIAEDPDRSSNHTTSNSSDIAAGFAASPETAAGPGRFVFEGAVDGRNYTGYRLFWACPNGEENPVDVYRVFIGDERLGKRCFGIEISTRNFTGLGKAAWGY